MSDPESSNAGDLVVRPSRRKGRLFVLLFGALLVAGLALLVFGTSWRDWFFGSALTISSAPLLLLGARRLWLGSPVLVLTDYGLEHPEFGRITWDDIRALPIKTTYYDRLLCIEVHDEAKFLARSRRVVRFLSWTTRLGRGPFLGFSETVLSAPAEQVREEIEARAGRTFSHGPNG